MSEQIWRMTGPGHSIYGSPARDAQALREGGAEMGKQKAESRKQKVESREQRESQWLLRSIARLREAIRVGCADARAARYRDHRAAHLGFARDMASVARADWARLQEMRRAAV